MSQIKEIHAFRYQNELIGKSIPFLPNCSAEQRVGLGVLQHRRVYVSSGAADLKAQGNARGALAIADRGYVMETGRVVLCGPATELPRDPQMRRAYLGL